jgi:AcrR family transcriptional regulator
MSAVVDATVEALGEIGYTRTTTAEISRRSGVSQGGVFRHFDTRMDVIVAAADRVRARQFDGFRAGLAGQDEVDLAGIVRLLRRATRAPINAAWYELVARRAPTAICATGWSPWPGATTERSSTSAARCRSPRTCRRSSSTRSSWASSTCSTARR